MNPEDYQPTPIWPLGSLYYLGKIENAPEGSPAAACSGLLELVQARRAGDRSSTAVSLHELKVIALDLVSHFSSTSHPPAPPALTTAIGLLMGLSEEELAAPEVLLEGRAKVGRPANANARDIAFYLDMFHWRETGQVMSLNSLVEAVADKIGVPVEKSVQTATLRTWRQEYVDMFDLRGEAKLD